jgi:mRNA interferase YafQ
MYRIRHAKEFDKSLRKIRHSGFTKKDEELLAAVIDILASGGSLDKRYKDHQLKGEFKDYRECHVLNDLLLMYKIEKGELILVLINIGSHSQLFG